MRQVFRYCESCQAERDWWLDATGPFSHGVRIMQVGTGQWNVPSHVSSHEVKRTQLQLIREHCELQHWKPRPIETIQLPLKNPLA